MSFLRRQHHSAPTMTRAANHGQYNLWLRTAPLDALAKADPRSIGNCYRVPAEQVERDIAGEPARRERVAAQFGGAA